MYRQFRSLSIIGAMCIAAGLPRVATAQAGKAQPATAPLTNPFATPPGVKRVPVSKAVFGDAGMIVNARDDGFVEVAAAGPKKTVMLQLRTLAARAWVDSTSRMMKARVKKADPARTYRSEITEYGTGTTMALTRSVTEGQSEFALAFAENPQSAFTVSIEPEEADVFVAIIRKAVAQSAKLLEKADTSAAHADSVARADSAARADSIAKARAARRRAAARRAAAAKDTTAKSTVPKPPATKDTTSKPAATKAPATKPPAPVKPA